MDLLGWSLISAGGRPRRLSNDAIELRMRPAWFADRGDEWWALVCYAWALMVKLYRAPRSGPDRDAQKPLFTRV